jgi:3-hydroxyisobutyrate dehydrogenase-like beta-hydroxyacid dehydrogenase
MKRSGRTGISRRTFLKGAAAAAVAAPLIIPSTAFGANDKIALGAIGVGNMGNSDLDQLIGRTQVVAVCDIDSRHREQTQKKVNDRYGGKGCEAYKDFRDLLARTDIDAVLVTTPDHWHAIIAIMAAKSGKDSILFISEGK